MIVQCPDCTTRYRLDPDRVPRERIRVRCPRCAYVFAIDGRVLDEPGASGPVPPARDAFPVRTESDEAFSARPASAAPEPTPVPAPEASPFTTAAQDLRSASRSVPHVAPEPRAPQAEFHPEPPAPVAAEVEEQDPTPVEPSADEVPVASGPEPEEGMSPPTPSPDMDLPIERSGFEAAPRPEAAPTAVAVEDEPARGERPADRSGAVPRPRTAPTAAEKNRRLARALVSDILVYNRDARDKALAEGTLVQTLGQEIKKSWELYKEKVGPEVASSTNDFREALNEILADGQKIF